MVCDINSRNCLQHVCENCPGLHGVRNVITKCFNENNIVTDEEITYIQWISTDRTTMNKLTSVDEYMTLLANKAFAFCEHHFRQSVYLRTQKENLQQWSSLSFNKIILLDFAENYSLVMQDAVQGFHWENRQATLHPLVVYHASPNNILEYLNTCVVSDHKLHNQSAVHAFLASALAFVKKVAFC